jgi:hypothetical protein
MISPRVLVLCAAIPLIGFWSNFANAQNTRSPITDQNESNQLFQQGYDAILAQDWHTAHEALSRAWALDERPEIAGLLGQAERKLCAERRDGSFCSLYLDAARHLDFALQHMTEDMAADPGARSRLEGWLADARMRIGALAIEAPAGSAITLDGRALGTSPITSDIFVEPGKHLITSTVNGSVTSSNVDVHRGERLRVVLDSKAAAVTTISHAPPGPRPHVKRKQRSRSITPLYIFGGVAVVAMGTGVALNIAKSADEDQVKQLKKQIPQSGCANPSSLAAQCSALHEAAERYDTKLITSWIAWGVAGAATAAGLAYLLWPQSAEPHGKAFRASLSLSGTASQVLLFGNF